MTQGPHSQGKVATNAKRPPGRSGGLFDFATVANDESAIHDNRWTIYDPGMPTK